ncbi:MAG: hypothetical protein GY845_18150 [Planctomycetes bacterium]|nr:hypothetical protein [Planctomycetota bacterium]
MKNLVFVLVIAFVFCTTAMASDIAFYVGQWNTDGWYDETQFADVETIITETGGLFNDIQQFDDTQLDEFGAWADDRMDDGVMDIIWLNGCLPSVLYPYVNLEPDGSRAEAWLDGGNMIINVGDWFGYVSYENGIREPSNGPDGAANILDLSSGIIMSADNTSLIVTPDGHEYIPSLNDAAITYRPVVISAVEAPWEVAAMFASTGGTDDAEVEEQADPIVIHNTETDGYVVIINQSAGSGPPGWIDDRGLTCAEFIGNWVNEVIGLGSGNPIARGPTPKEGTLHEDTWINLTWRPGPLAVSHDVYFGESFDAVNEGAEGTFVGNQGGTFLVVGFPGFPYPDGLIPGTTYYWRVDEVNDTEPNSPWKGDVWSFSIPPKTAYFPVPAEGAEAVAVDVQLSWTPGFGAKLHTVYFGDNFDDVSNAAGGLPQGTLTYSPDTLNMAKTYYWRVDEFDAIETYTGGVWNFTTEGAVAALDPANGAVDVTQTPVLTWALGLGASHEVYFGADAASLELKGSGNLGSESYEPGELEWNTTYYWRIDEANNANADSPWTGPLWSFTTANFLIIDDIESYNDLDEGEPGSNRIYLAWVDGFDNPTTNGSTVGNLNPPFAEQSIVHSGNQSMPFAYDNAVGKSEATLTLTSNNDWTVNGVDTLTIWYRGSSSNAAETMYVVLNGSAGVDNDNPDATLDRSWTEWNIDLQAFADQGVNLTNVTSITLGFGDRSNPVAGGAGSVFFDDIRLYAPAP